VRILVVFMAGMVVCLVGCGSDNSGEQSLTTPEVAESPPLQETPDVGTPIPEGGTLRPDVDTSVPEAETSHPGDTSPPAVLDSPTPSVASPSPPDLTPTPSRPSSTPDRASPTPREDSPTLEPEDLPWAQVDVAIIGGGAAGLAAAVAALELGAEVLLIERQDSLGGAARYAGRAFAAGTRWQEAAGIEDSPEMALEEWPTFTSGDATAHWVQGFVNNSAETLEWLLSHGGSISRVDPDAGAGEVPRMHLLGSDGQTSPWQALVTATTPHAWLNLEATGIRIGPLGVSAVEVHDLISDQVGIIEAVSVVVATGGFARNRLRMLEAVPGLAAFPEHVESWPGALGSGLDLLEVLGVQLTNLENTGLYAHGVVDAWLGSPEVMVLEALRNTIIVDPSGTRLMDESDQGSFHLSQLYVAQGPLFAIVDATGWARVAMNGLGYNYIIGEEGQRLTAAQYDAQVAVPQAESIAALANLSGIDASGLEVTVGAYNDGFETGQDAFGKALDDLAPLEIPPFYGLPLVVAGAKSFGGAALSDTGEVLDRDGLVIPGLFAAGEVAGMLGGSYVGIGFSGSITACYYTGRVAGDNGARRALGLTYP